MEILRIKKAFESEGVQKLLTFCGERGDYWRDPLAPMQWIKSESREAGLHLVASEKSSKLVFSFASRCCLI